MPQPLPPQTDELIRDLQASLRDCQQRLALLEGRRRLDLPRGLTENIPAPGEGEVLVRADTEEPWYYSNGQWRPFGGSTPMPFAYSQFSGNSLDDGIDYSLGVYEGEFEPAGYGGTEGIADAIAIVNDAAGDVFRESEDATMLWAAGGPGLFAFDIACYFSTGFTGRVDLYPFILHPGVYRYSNPALNVLSETLFTDAANGSITIRASGVVYLDMPAWGDNDTNANLMLTARIAQDSGAARTLSQGWMLWSRLTAS